MQQRIKDTLATELVWTWKLTKSTTRKRERKRERERERERERPIRPFDVKTDIGCVMDNE